MTREEKLTALLMDEEARKELFVEDADQTLANFAAHGMELSREELADLSAGILNGMEPPEGELSESDLEDVAGGIFVDTGMLIGLRDGIKNTDKGVQYVESSHTMTVKGLRAIGYCVGYRVGRFFRTGKMD